MDRPEGTVMGLEASAIESDRANLAQMSLNPLISSRASTTEPTQNLMR